jgi:hypothetical protein
LGLTTGILLRVQFAQSKFITYIIYVNNTRGFIVAIPYMLTVYFSSPPLLYNHFPLPPFSDSAWWVSLCCLHRFILPTSILFTSTLISIMVTLVYFPTKCMKVPFPPHPRQHLLFVCFLDDQSGVRWNLSSFDLHFLHG